LSVIHQSCPVCPSSDAFAVYDDGHGYCFSCKHYQPSDATRHLQSIMGDVNHNPGILDARHRPMVKETYLPEDADKTIDFVALNWLSQYDILREEVIEHDLRWSPSRRWLVFPYKGEGNKLLAYQARNFNNTGPKWLTFGDISETLHLLGLRCDPNCGILLVEDIVSAIKCSRQITTMSLFGSQLGLKTALRIKKLTKKVFIWMDADKFSEAIEGMARRLELIGVDTHILYTEKDPKECTDKEIKLLTSL
jgi:hypothetical protein